MTMKSALETIVMKCDSNQYSPYEKASDLAAEITQIAKAALPNGSRGRPVRLDHDGIWASYVLGAPEKEIAVKFNCTVPSVKRIIKLREAENGPANEADQGTDRSNGDPDEADAA